MTRCPRKLSRKARARSEKTGESYSTALANLRAQKNGGSEEREVAASPNGNATDAPAERTYLDLRELLGKEAALTPEVKEKERRALLELMKAAFPARELQAMADSLRPVFDQHRKMQDLFAATDPFREIRETLDRSNPAALLRLVPENSAIDEYLDHVRSETARMQEAQAGIAGVFEDGLRYANSAAALVADQVRSLEESSAAISGQISQAMDRLNPAEFGNISSLYNR